MIQTIFVIPKHIKISFNEMLIIFFSKHNLYIPDTKHKIKMSEELNFIKKLYQKL